LPQLARFPRVIPASGWVAAGGQSPVLVTGDVTRSLALDGPSDSYAITGISDDGHTIVGKAVVRSGQISRIVTWNCD
jgi:hypothetical protein